MNIITQLDHWIEFARQQNYEVRFDWFGGTGGGVCQVNGRKVLFIVLVAQPVIAVPPRANFTGLKLA